MPARQLLRIEAGHQLALRLIDLQDIERNPGPTRCAICNKSNWNVAGVWCGRGGWVHVRCTSLKSYKEYTDDGTFDCRKCKWCIAIYASTKYSISPQQQQQQQKQSKGNNYFSTLKQDNNSNKNLKVYSLIATG